MAVLFIKINHLHAFFDIIYAVKLKKKKRFQKTATWVPSVISINRPSNREFVMTLFISENGLRYQKTGWS